MGTVERGLFEKYQRTLLNFRSATDQDAIIARLVQADLREKEEKSDEPETAEPKVKRKKITSRPSTTYLNRLQMSEFQS